MEKQKRIIIQTYGSIEESVVLCAVWQVIDKFIKLNRKDCLYTLTNNENNKTIICYMVDNGKSIKIQVYYEKED